MKSGRIFSIIAVGLLLGAGCSSTNDTSGTGGSAGSGGSSGGSTGGSSGGNTGGSSGANTGGSAGVGGSAGSGGSTKQPGKLDDDCYNIPCASPLVCCPTTNTCTPNSSAICASPVMVACTKSADCGSQKCCVTPATTTGSGPSGAVCQANCDAPSVGVACNVGPIGGKTADCPAGTQWDTCFPVANSPAGLGVCIPFLTSDR